MPQISEESSSTKSADDLLAGYRSTSKPRSVGIKERLMRGVEAAKKRGLALKLGHEVRSLQTAIACS